MKFDTLYRIVQETESEKPITFFHVTPTYNLDSISRHGLEPRIGPRSEKDNEEEAGVFLFANHDDAEDAVMNWLADEFDEDEPLKMLRISIPQSIVDDMNIYHDGLSYVSLDVIPPEYISVENIEL